MRSISSKGLGLIVKIIVVIMMLLLLVAGWLYVSLSTCCVDEDDWYQAPIYSIRLKGNVWQSSDIQPPVKVHTAKTILEYDTEIPHRYQLDREYYKLVVEINPKQHSWPVNLQISTIGQLNSKVLRVESSWQGNCGITENTSSVNGEEVDIYSRWYPYSTKPKAIGFLWYYGTGYCKDDAPQTTEYASSFPIMLKIYDDEHLLGEEQIDFEIFENGIRKYLVMP